MTIIKLVKKSVHKHKIHKKHSAKISINQKGKSKVLLIIVAVIVIAALGGGYVLTQKAGVSIPGMRPALNPNCELKDPELCKFMNNMTNQKDHAVTTKSNLGGLTMESLTEVSGTEKMHMVSKQNDKEISNSISIGDTTYTLDYSDNKWWKQTLKIEETETDAEEEIQDDFDIPETKDTTTYKFIAKEACGDHTCFKYELIDTSSTAESKQFIWFDDWEYLIRKMTVETARDGSMESVYTYGNINISAPSPVKEGAPGMGQYSEEEAQKMMEQYQQQAPETYNYDEEAPVDSSESEY